MENFFHLQTLTHTQRFDGNSCSFCCLHNKQLFKQIKKKKKQNGNSDKLFKWHTRSRGTREKKIITPLSHLFVFNFDLKSRQTKLRYALIINFISLFVLFIQILLWFFLSVNCTPDGPENCLCYIAGEYWSIFNG